MRAFEPTAVAVDSANVYWATPNGWILKVPIDGGKVTSLASGQTNPVGIAVDEASVYWLRGLKHGIAGGREQFSTTPVLFRIPVNGGVPKPLASGHPIIIQHPGLVVTATDVFWTESDRTGGAVMKLQK